MSEDAEREAVLAWAAAARVRRDEVVASVATGQTELATVLADRHDPLVGPIKLVVVVQAVRGVGKVHARRALSRLGLDDHRLADVTDDQAAALLAEVSAAGG